MAAALPIIGAVTGIIGAGATIYSMAKGTPAATATQPLVTPTRDNTQKIVDQQDALARRKGAAADILTGSSGAEAGAGTTGRLVLGS